MRSCINYLSAWGLCFLICKMWELDNCKSVWALAMFILRNMYFYSGFSVFQKTGKTICPAFGGAASQDKKSAWLGEWQVKVAGIVLYHYYAVYAIFFCEFCNWIIRLWWKTVYQSDGNGKDHNADSVSPVWAECSTGNKKSGIFIIGGSIGSGVMDSFKIYQ